MLNSKLSLDEQYDNRRELLARERAWEDLKLRKAQNAATFDHFVDMTTAGATAASQQTGQTENQQTVSPIRTGAGDAIAAVPGVSAGAISADVANFATGIVGATLQAVFANLPALITASGTAARAAQPNPTPVGA